MNIIFMGTPDFAVPTFNKIISSTHNIVAVFTQKPKPKNRGMALSLSPIHELAQKNNIDATKLPEGNAVQPLSKNIQD